MSHFRSYSKTTYNVAIAVFFMMMIKGMYTKEAPFPKSGRWSVDGLEIFFGQFM